MVSGACRNPEPLAEPFLAPSAEPFSAAESAPLEWPLQRQFVLLCVLTGALTPGDLADLARSASSDVS
eukprot:3301532-Pleurochrysis_carterae.AAC.1